MPFRRSAPLLKFALFLPLLLAVGACSLFHHGKRDTLNNMTVEQLYQRGHQLSEDGNWGAAQTVYQKLISRFPYGPYNEQAQIELAYAQYKDDKFEDAYSTINEFIKTYPTQKHIAYAYYLRGLINFDRTETGMQKMAGISPSRFDQGYVLQSFDDFNTLIARFPNTPYAADARERMIYLRNQLARSELNVAEFYLQRKAYIAAADRAKYIIEHYQRSPETADALAVLAKSYHLLGQQKLADQTTQVLKLNYPDHPYLRNPRGRP
jgi:outer membrane protein assembly factor BamD